MKWDTIGKTQKLKTTMKRDLMKGSKRDLKTALDRDIEKFTGLKHRQDASDLLMKSKRLIKLAKGFYEQSKSIRDVVYLMAREQGLMLNEDQVRAMVNKHRRKENKISD